MSESLLIAILSISELTLITMGVAVFLFMRNRRMSKELNETPTQAPRDEVAETVPEVTFADYLQQNIEQTKQRLSNLPDDQARILEARLGFLQAETSAQELVDDEEAYWRQLIADLETLLPENTPDIIESQVAEDPGGDQPEDDEPPTLDELDDIDIQESLDNIPVLKDSIDDPGGETHEPTSSMESASEDIERLREIINRQHNTMDELKKALQEKEIDLENNQELSKKLEEIEVAQAQLNMCVETLEKENQRLNQMIKGHEDSPQQEQLIQAKQDLDDANERIHSLEKENSLQAVRISELESEIAELEKALQQRSEELARVQHMETDLSQTDDSEQPSEDSLMKEIETLTELITQKSEELSKLQSESIDEFGFDNLSGLDAEDPAPDKAAQTG